jgi:hypothetical protein
VSNVDLVAVMQSDAAGQRAGVTKFIELTGEYAGAEHRASYRNIALQGGVLRGNGAVDVAANSALNGRLALEIRSQVAQDHGAFTITGTVGRPIIKRGSEHCAGSSRSSGSSFRIASASGSPSWRSCCRPRWCS